MKTKNYLIIGILGIALTGVVFTGCKKKSTAPSNPTDTTSAQDDANAAFAMQDSKNIADGAAKGQAAERIAGPCAVILRRDTLSHADSLIDINFGPTDCSCLDGRMRRGHIFVWYVPGQYFNNGSVIVMTFKNYYVNDIGVTGTRTLTNSGLDSAGMFTWNFVANLTLTYPNGGGTATWNSTRTNTLQKVNGIWYYAVTGTASGTSRKNASYNITITSPLYVTAPHWPNWLADVSFCKYIEAGALTITVSSFAYPIYVNYGSASALGPNDCHSSATATINGIPYNFTQQ